MARSASAFILTLAIGCASASPKGAPVAADRVVPDDVVDIRGIWRDNDLDPEGSAERGLDAKQIVTPRKIRNVPPVYPSDVRGSRVQGTVTIECIIEVSGEPTACVATGGPMQLRNSAMDAVRDWRWRPLTAGGVPKRALVQLTVTFTVS